MFLPICNPSSFAADRKVRGPKPGTRLGEAELRVIALARCDASRPGWEGAAAGRLTRLWQALTGLDPVRPLADERLEKLRLFVCAMRRRDRRASQLAEALVATGYQPTAIRAVTALALA